MGTLDARAAIANGSADMDMTDQSKTATPSVHELSFEDDLPSHPWNVKVQVPTYTHEQYESMLKSDDWTREETDYLIHLCRDYDLRWIIIADRYNPQDITTSTSPTQDGETNGPEVATKPHYPGRTMESLKQRYYSIAAKLMEITTPASTMTATDFQLWEKMRTFDAKTETMRKAMAEKLFERTKDEADEERILLEELHRITKNDEEFIRMRRDLYTRLEPVAPLRRSGNGEEQSTAMYQTSSGLSMLLQTLLAKEKRLRRPAMPEGASGASTSTPTDPRHDKARQSSQYSRRDTFDTQATEDGPQKKHSISQPPTVRTLAPADAAKFGVSYPQERLTSGVQFRHEKINRLTMAKSQTQTTKIQAALTELGIPARLLMPTERVCREFERLVAEINTLLDCRKVSEKVSAEIRILEEQRRMRLGLPKEGEGQGGQNDGQSFPNVTDALEIDDSQVGESSKIDQSMAVAEEDQDAEAEDDEPTHGSIRDHGGEENDETVLHKERQQDGDEDADGDNADKAAEDEDEDEDEDQNDDEVTGIDNEDEDEDDDADADDQPQLNVDEDDDEEIAPTPQEDSDAEEAESDDEDEQEAQVNIDEDDFDAGAEAKAQAAAQAAAGASSNDEQASGDSDDIDMRRPPPSDPEEDLSDISERHGGEGHVAEEDEEDEGEEEVTPPPVSVPAIRAVHKRSASVISAASRAASNRSGVGRKKRR